MKQKRVSALAILLGFGILLTAFAIPIQAKRIPTGREYDTRIGGRIFGPIYEVKQAASKELTHDSKIFSTYSAALQCMRGSFNETGFDYIIHALGNDYRSQYVADFLRSSPDYVLVPREMRFSFWSISEFWWFSKEVFERYEVQSVDFARYLLFKRSSSGMLLENNPAVRVSTKAADDTGTEVLFIAPSGSPGLLEATISYEIAAPWDAINRVLLVEQDWIDSENQISNVSGPAASEDFTFLVIVNESGVGRVLLNPLFGHSLILRSCKTGNLYKNPYLETGAGSAISTKQNTITGRDQFGLY